MFSNASQKTQDIKIEADPTKPIHAFKVAMLGASGVGKTALTYQFTTSEYICAYDLSLGMFYFILNILVLQNVI